MHASPDRILQTGLAFWSSKVLLSAVEMEVFTELAKHPGDLATLQGRLGLHPRAARDFLDSLVALGFLQRTDGVYRNTAETDLFLDKRKPSYIGGILEMANHRLYPFWAKLMSLNMVIETPGGFDYTGADCIGWMQEAGFSDCRVEHLVGPDSMVIGFKR